MSKLLVTVSAIGLTALIALPGAASAREQTQNQAALSMKTSNSIEVSSARRHRHYRHYGYRHRYYRPYAYSGYNAYAYDPYYRPYYYRPGFSVGVGPFGFGFGF
jgi:Ni/Co efflux regulator RcnB